MSLSEALVPEIFNVTLTLADTEYSQALSVRTKYFSLQCRTGFDIRYAFETGKVATPTAPYATVKANTWYNSPEKFSWSGTIYLGSSEAGVVAEIIAWLALA